MKPTPQEIYDRAASRGLRLIPRGCLLEVTPKSRLTPELLAVIRANKMELLAWLDRVRRNGLLRQVLDGQFDGADNATREHIIQSLHGIPQARSAIARLESEATR